jgi:HK97 family phage portal protein
MKVFGLFEKRSASPLENPEVSLSDARAWADAFGRSTNAFASAVTEVSALSIPAVWQANNAISGTIASLPVHLFKKNGDNAEKDTTNPLYYILHDAPNDTQTSQQFLKWLVTRLLLEGRATVFIDRNGAGRVKRLIPINSTHLKVKQVVIKNVVDRQYTVSIPGQPVITYNSRDVIDLIWFPQQDGVQHYNPIDINRNAIGLMLAVEQYAGTMFSNGGVPPFVLEAPAMMNAQMAARASVEVAEAIKATQQNKNNVLVAPAGHSLKTIGLDPLKQQMVEVRRFQISETARIWNIAPALLHDLSTGTYSNVEQQMLSFVTQTIHPLVQMIEQEFNAKLFGARNSSSYVKFNLNGLLRGDFAARMEGLTKAVSGAIYTPNEARAFEDLPPQPDGDKLYIQGATVPLGTQPTDGSDNQPQDKEPADADEEDENGNGEA